MEVVAKHSQIYDGRVAFVYIAINILVVCMQFSSQQPPFCSRFSSVVFTARILHTRARARPNFRNGELERKISGIEKVTEILC